MEFIVKIFFGLVGLLVLQKTFGFVILYIIIFLLFISLNSSMFACIVYITYGNKKLSYHLTLFSLFYTLITNFCYPSCLKEYTSLSHRIQTNWIIGIPLLMLIFNYSYFINFLTIIQGRLWSWQSKQKVHRFLKYSNIATF